MLKSSVARGSQEARNARSVAPRPDRRSMLAALVVLPALIVPSIAKAVDPEAAKAAKEARRKALREAAGGMKSTGEDAFQIFAVPEYSLSEESRTPNSHARQSEATKTQAQKSA
eukprot:gene14420-20426_t